MRRGFGWVASACWRCGTAASGSHSSGIPLATPSGSVLFLEAHHRDATVTRHELEIGPKAYASQHLKVKPGQVDLSANDLARYERERAHLAAVLKTFTEDAPTDLRMLQPTPGRRSSSFGLRRYFNGEPRNPHGGMDIAAPVQERRSSPRRRVASSISAITSFRAAP